MKTIATILILLIISALFAHQSFAEESIRLGLILTTESNERFDKLVFGIDPKATTGLDTALGERDYPGFPPNQFHAFMIIVDRQTNEEFYSYKNFEPFPEGKKKYYTTFKFEFIPYSGDTITVRWGTLPKGVDSAYFTKPYAGNDLFSINMKDNPSYTFYHRDMGATPNALFKVWFTREITGIADAAERSKSIALYPNPADDALTLKNLRDKSSYRIYNILGEVVKQGTLYGEISQINIQNFQAGYYYVKIVDSNGNQQNRSFLKK